MEVVVIINLIKRLLMEEDGQGMSEYAIVLGAIAVGVIILLRTYSGQVQTLWTSRITILD